MHVHVDLTKEEIGFSHEGLSAHAHNIVQEVEAYRYSVVKTTLSMVEVHGWLVSGRRRLYFAALF